MARGRELKRGRSGTGEEPRTDSKPSAGAPGQPEESQSPSLSNSAGANMATSSQASAKRVARLEGMKRSVVREVNDDVDGRRSARSIILSPKFDCFITSLIVLNALLIGMQVQHDAVSNSKVGWFDVVEYFFTAVFTFELVARIAILRQRFWTDPAERHWNAFDALLVLISWLDVFVSEVLDADLPVDGSMSSKFARLVRILRIMRVLRTVKLLTHLRIMVSMIAKSLRSLLWIIIIMVLIIYSFAIILTQGATYHLKSVSGELPPLEATLRDSFGSLFSTMYTLFKCVSAGVEWADLAPSIGACGWVFEIIFVVYLGFTLFAVINIVNGVFVDGAIEHSREDRMMLVEKQKHDEVAKEWHLVNLLRDIDKDGDQEISYQEFCDSLETPTVQDFLHALKIEITDAKAVFTMLDLDESGQVNILEFVSGMMKLRGDARSIDIHMMMYENKRLSFLLDGLAAFVHEKLDGM